MGFAMKPNPLRSINAQDPQNGENQLPQLVLQPPYEYVACMGMQNTNKVNTIENLTSQPETQWEPISIKKEKEKTKNSKHSKSTYDLAHKIQKDNCQER